MRSPRTPALAPASALTPASALAPTDDRSPRRVLAPVVRPVVPRVLLARDIPPDDLRARVRDGSLVRVLRGTYAEPATETEPWSAALHLLLCRAVAVHAARPGVHWFSHRTAAALWGCALDLVPTAVDVTAPVARRSTRDRRRTGVVEHWTADARRAAQVTDVLALPVTSLARTLVDCASTLPGPSGLVVVDSGLRAGADPDELRRVLAGSTGQRGIRRARTVVERGDDRAESAGESLVRWHLLAQGVPGPEPQVAVETRLGRRWVDLGWREERLAVEFDGRTKYGGEGREAAAAVFAEKRRQDALEEAGWRVLRVTWADLRDPPSLASRVRRALRAAGRGPARSVV